jgi:hypothetical protein
LADASRQSVSGILTFVGRCKTLHPTRCGSKHIILAIAKGAPMGGTCTGEHGIGQGKQKYLNAELGAEAIDAMRSAPLAAKSFYSQPRLTNFPNPASGGTDALRARPSPHRHLAT